MNGIPQLTDEIKARINANKERAKILSLQRKQEALTCSADSSKNPLSPVGEVLLREEARPAELSVENEVCLIGEGGDNLTSTCGQLVDRTFWKAFGERCCTYCRSRSDDWEMISKDIVHKEYLIPISSIGLMRFLEKPNPLNPHWAPMQLFLRKQAREKALKRWGSVEALQREKDRRSEVKLRKDLESVADYFSSATSGASASAGAGAGSGVGVSLCGSFVSIGDSSPVGRPRATRGSTVDEGDEDDARSDVSDKSGSSGAGGGGGFLLDPPAEAGSNCADTDRLAGTGTSDAFLSRKRKGG